MAKGNDGNYLQHSMELAVALLLAKMSTRASLHLALTHGMAPFERCEPPSGEARTLLDRALETAQNPPTCGESPIVAAYRATNASRERYPNAGELLAATIGRERLSGGIAETNVQKHASLVEAWSGSSVTPVHSSWRREVRPESTSSLCTAARGVLSCPATLLVPWLFAADPMTFSEDGYADDDKLYRADLSRLSTTLKEFIASGEPGVAALFVYAVRRDVRPLFWKFADDLGAETGLPAVSCWVPHRGGNRNLAVLLCSGIVLPPCWLPHGINAGR